MRRCVCLLVGVAVPRAGTGGGWHTGLASQNSDRIVIRSSSLCVHQGRGVVRSTAQYSRPRTLRSTCVVLRRYCGYKYINFYYLRWWGARAARSERWFARCRGAVESEGTRVVASILVATAALRTRRSDFFLVHFFCRLAAGTSLRRHGRFVVVEFQVFVRVSKQVLLFLHVVVNI